VNLLFLDVDGVLTDSSGAGLSASGLGSNQLRLLERLVTTSRCGIVVISSWRECANSMAALRAAFAEHGIPEWIDVTPDLPAASRGKEILSWLRSNINGSIVAVGIDDRPDIVLPEDHDLPVGYKPLIADFCTGLTAELVQEAIDWFAPSR
jgi:hypothetical protein